MIVTLLLAPALGGLGVSVLRNLAGGFEPKKKADAKPGAPAPPAGGAPSARATSAKAEASKRPAMDGLGTFFETRVRAPLRPVLKATAAMVTLGTGASLGPEGPSVDIGRAVAKGIGALDRVTLFSEGRRASYIAAGAAAGVAAGFNAAIAGVFYAIESVLAEVGARGRAGTV